MEETQEAEDMSADAEEDVEDLSDEAEEDIEETPKEKPAKEPPKKSWTGNLKDLGDKAKKFITDAPKDIQKFVNDPQARKKALSDVTSALKKAPQKYARSLVETAKHEVKEFKEAGAGIKAVLMGGKMSAPQKKAFKAVSLHVALGVTAVVLTASGPLAVAGAFGKGLVKYVAMRAATRSLGNIHVLQEMGHVGHGIEGILHHMAGEEKEPNVDEMLGNYVTAMVVKELEGL